MKRISYAEAEQWVNLPELRRFQRGPALERGDTQWISLAERAHDGLFLVHDGVLGIFHPAPFDGVYFAHHAVPKSRWGRRGAEAAKAIVLSAWDGLAPAPERFIAWTMSSNRLSVRFAERLGFELDFLMPYRGEFVAQLGAVRCQVAAALK